ncbi:MAG: HD domain-containing protein [Rhodocyclaceae bacterium]|nr:HD domain-containing protein [Rhodocyclaceae bacterium]
MALVKLGYGYLSPGQVLAFDLLDEQGRTLLSNGYVLQSQAQIDRLVERGVFFDRIEDESIVCRQAERVSIYLRISQIADDYIAAAGDDTPDPQRILAIAAELQATCELDSNPALAAILLRKTSRYSLRHAFGAAVLAEVLLREMGRTPAQRQSAVAGALTMNLAMLELQDTLYHQQSPLTTEQKRGIIEHPGASARMLRSIGVGDPLWLDVVEHHHEMLNGTGYAKKLTGSALSLEAQAVSLADRYCAMVSERSYRPATLPAVAAKDLLTRQGGTIDPALAAVFMREVGIYPPGSVVALANGEVAVVIKRTLNPAQPVVRSLRAPSGVRHAQPPKRLTSKPAYAIRNALDTELARDFDLVALWPPAHLDNESEE